MINNKNEFEKFLDEATEALVNMVTSEIDKYFSEAFIAGKKVKIEEIHKGPGNTWHALLLVASKGASSAPCLYLEEYMQAFVTLYMEIKNLDSRKRIMSPEAYKKEAAPIEEKKRIILSSIAANYEAMYTKWGPTVSADVQKAGEAFADFDKIKDKLRFRVIDMQGGEDYLSARTHKEIDDGFAAVFFFDNVVEDTMMYITPQNVEILGKTIEELWEIALENMQKYVPVKVTETPHISLIAGGEYKSYIVSSSTGEFGASCLFYPNVREMVADYVGEDYYMVFANIHNVHIIPASVQFPKGKSVQKFVDYVNMKLESPTDFVTKRAVKYIRTK